MARLQVRVLTAVTALVASTAVMVGTGGTAAAAPTPMAQTFTYTGAVQNFTVPAGITELTLSLTGAEGGRGGQDGAVGAPGGYKGIVSGTVTVTPGTVLSIGVGGGGTNGLQRSGATNNVTTPAGLNPLGGYAGGVGGTAGPDGASGNGGGGGAATVVTFGGTALVAGGAGGGGGSGQFIPITGRPGEATPTPRTDTVATSGQPGANTQPLCTGRCDGGASGGGGGGAVGGARGAVEFGAGTNTEYFGYGGYPGTSATGGLAGVTAVYQYYAGNNANGAVTISYITGSPAAPTAVAGTADNAAVDLTWTAPTATGGAPVTDYVVEYSSNNGASWSTFADGTSATTGTTVTGLTNGTAYVFRVSAVNSFGTGTVSTVSGPVTPSNVPTAPTLGTVVRGNGSLTVPFSGATAVSPITGYEYAVDGGPWIATGSTTSPLTVTGLTNGTSYGIAVRAVNAIGAGVASAPATGTPATTPGAPSITTATTGPTSAVLTFGAGATGGSAITGYEYQLDGGAWTSAGTTASPITITGLTDGTLYAARIRAVNALGAGAASNPVDLTTSNVPGAPVIDTVTPLDGALSVAFTPSSTGGLAIAGFEYQVDGGAWVPAGTTSPLLVPGLTNGTAHSVRVRAVNTVGAGAASATADGTPRTVPGAPVLTSSTAVGEDLEIAFTAPASTGGATITGYEYSTDGGATWRARATGATNSPLTISTLSSDGTTPLTAGTEYPIELRAVNAAGSGAASSVLSASGRTTPSAPVVASVAGRPSALLVTVTPPANGGEEITAYEYRLDGGTWTATGTTGPVFVVGGLTNGTTYGVQVRALNTLGASGPSSTVSGTPVAVPGAAVITDVAPIDRALRITAAVADNGGSAVTGWEYTTDGGATWAAATGTTSPFTVTHLSSNTATLLNNATSYSVAVRARNAVGPGGSSATVSAAPSATPSAPVITVTPGNARIQVAYTIGSDGGSPLTDVQYRLDNGDWTNAGTITSPFTIPGLTNGTTYAVTLRGVNSRGDGAVSTSASSTPRTIPGAPTAVTTVSEAGSATVSWTAPADNGGAAITGYTATAWTAPNGGTVAGTCTGVTLTCSIPGLSNGTPYYVSVVATNVAGTGPASAPRVAVTPLARPSAPVLTSVTPNNTYVTVAFTAGAAGTSPITGYQYQLNGGAWVNATGTTTPITLSGLTNGTAYDVALRAVSAAGPGAASNVLPATPYTLPDVPNAATIVGIGGTNQITVSWAAPNANGRPITAYNVVLWNAATVGSQIYSCTTTALSCTITGPANGVVYYATVDATNLAGTSARSNPRIPIAAGTAPGAPTAVTGTPADGQVALSWTAGTTGTGAATTDYAVSYSTDGVTWTPFTDGVSTTTSTTVTGLTNGTAYTFRVQALSPSGAGAVSAASAAVTPVGTGTVPTFGTVTRTPTGFTAPITNATAAVTYSATATNGGTATVTGSTVTVTGLAANTASTVTVTATRPGYTTVSGTVSGTSLQAGTVPIFGPVTRTATGWSVVVSNYDAAVTYAVSSTGGTSSISGNTVTVSGLAAGAGSEVTLTATRAGYTITSASVAGTALEAGVAPTFGPVTRTVDGYTVAITNLDATTSYALTTSGTGTATLSGAILTVTGVAPGASATVTVVAAKPGAVLASAPVTGTALASGAAPTFGTVTRLAGGFSAPVTNLDATASYTAVSTQGTAVISGGTVTVSGLSAGQSAVVTVTVVKAGSTDATGVVSGTALQAGTAPVLSDPVRTADGFTVEIDSPDAAVTYTAEATAGVAAVVGGLVTVSDLDPGQTATVTVTATRGGYTTESTPATGSALEAGTAPVLSEPIRTADGFTVEIDEPDAAVAYTAETTAGIAVVVGGLVTVSDLDPGETATVTVIATRTGYTSENASATGSALEAGTAPVLSQPIRSATGFTVEIDEPDANVAYTAVTTAGIATVVDGLITVSGLQPGASATVTVVATRAGYTTESTPATGSALEAGTAPVLSEPVRSADGFTVTIDEPDANVTYTAVSTAGLAVVLNGVVTVSELAFGQTATVTVIATRAGFTTETTSTTGSALLEGSAPDLADPVRTTDGFTVEILDEMTDPVTGYTVVTAAGTAEVLNGTVTVRGLDPGQTATVTVVATRAGFTTRTTPATGSALLTGSAPDLADPIRTADGFTVEILDDVTDPVTDYTAVSTAGIVTVANGVVTVSGLNPGQTATVTVVATRAGYTTETTPATGSALATGTQVVLGTVVRTEFGYTVGIDEPDPGTTYTVSASAGTAQVQAGVVTVVGLTPNQAATVTVTATKAGVTTTTASITGSALEAGSVPQLSPVTRTRDGYSVTVLNTDPTFTYTATSGAGSAAVTMTGGVATVTVSGLQPGASTTVTVVATRDGHTTRQSAATGAALASGTAPTTGPVTRTADGFTFVASSPDPEAELAVVTTAGEIEIAEDGTVTVTGLTPGQSAAVTVAALREGVGTETTMVINAALFAGTVPSVPPAPTQTVDGFVFAVVDPVSGTTYTATTTAGEVTVVDGIVTVTGLAPGETAVVTVTATRPGDTTETVQVTESALRTGTPVVLTAPTPVVGGFEVTIVDPVPGTLYTAVTSAGTVTIVDGVITVTGLAPGEAALLTVTATRVGDTVTSARAAGAAPSAPEVALTGGGTVTATTSTPVISGYAPDAPAGSLVTVTVNGQVLTTTVGPDGYWSVTPAALPDGEYEVVVAITVLGVTGTVTQKLTVATTVTPAPTPVTPAPTGRGPLVILPPAVSNGTGGLAYTGLDARVPGTIGTGLLVLGALLLGLARRRRPDSVTAGNGAGNGAPPVV